MALCTDETKAKPAVATCDSRWAASLLETVWMTMSSDTKKEPIFEMKRSKFPKNDPQGRTMSDAHDRSNARPAQAAGSGTEVIHANPKDGTLGRGRSLAQNLSSTVSSRMKKYRRL